MTETKTLYDYWMICYRKRISIMLLVSVSVVGAILISRITPPIYEARAIFYIPGSATTNRTNVSEEDLPLPTSNQDDAKANIGILKGRNATQVIHDWFPSKPISALSKDVDFTAGRDGLIYIYVRDRSPVMAAAISNAYINYFNIFMLNKLQERLTPKQTVLKERIDVVSAQLTEAYQARKRLQKKFGTPALDVEAVALVQEREVLRRDLENLKGGITTGSGMKGSKDGVTPAMDELEKEIAKLEVQLAGSLVENTPAYPDVQVASKRYDQAKQALSTKQSQSTSLTKTQEKALLQMIEKRNQRLAEIPEYKRLEELNNQEIQNLITALSFLHKNQEELAYSRVRSKTQGITVETALTPTTPVYPIVWLNAVVALILGLLTGILYAFLLDYIEVMRSGHRKTPASEEVTQ